MLRGHPNPGQETVSKRQKAKRRPPTYTQQEIDKLLDGCDDFQRTAQCFIHLDRPGCRCPGSGVGGRRGHPAKHGKDHVGIGQTDPGPGVTQVLFDRLLQVFRALIQSLFRQAVPMVEPLKIQLVRLRALRRRACNALQLFSGQPQAQLLRDLVGDLLLDRQDVGHVAIVLLAPQHGAIARVHQLGSDRERVDALHQPAFQHGAHPQLPADFLDILVLTLIAEHRVSRLDLQVRYAREARDEALGNPVAQVFCVGIAARIDEGQHGQRVDGLAPRKCIDANGAEYDNGTRNRAEGAGDEAELVQPRKAHYEKPTGKPELQKRGALELFNLGIQLAQDVPLDPAVSTGEDSDDTGIVVAGLGVDGHGYILQDATCHLDPFGWAPSGAPSGIIQDILNAVSSSIQKVDVTFRRHLHAIFVPEHIILTLLLLSACWPAWATDPHLTSRLVSEGLALAKEGRQAEAALKLRQAVEADPNNVTAYNNLGVILRRQKDFEGAVDAFQAAIKLRPKDFRIYGNLAWSLHGAGRLDAALEAMKKGCSIEPNNATLRRNLGMLLLEAGDHQQAEKELKTATRLDPNNAAAHQTLASLLAQLGRSQEAIEAFRACLRLEPRRPDVHYALGRLHEAKGELEQAAREYRAAVDLDGNYVEAQAALGNVLVQLGDLDAAETEIRRALKLQPLSGQCHRDLGIVLLRRNNLEEAVAALRRARELIPGDSATVYTLGLALRKAGRKEEATAALRAAQRLNEEARTSLSARSLNNAAAKLLQEGQVEEAKVKLREAIRVDPQNIKAHYNLGLALLRGNQLNQAIVEFRTTLRRKPDHANAYYYLGRGLLAKNQVAAAVEALEEAVRLMPEAARAHNGLAVALATISGSKRPNSKLERAISELRTALRLEPANPLFQENLACLQRGGGCALTP